MEVFGRSSNEFSYGLNSPGTIYPNFSRIVNEHGVIEYGFDDNGAYVDDSYGSPDIGNDYVECHIGEEGYVFSDVWVFTEDSYGNKNS